MALRSDRAEATPDLLPRQLSSPQLDAVLADDRLLSVLAGAGAGKTRVLTLRVARRIHDASALTDRVLVCTFSRKAAEEIGTRLRGLAVPAVRSGTFHRLALSLIQQHRGDRQAGGVAVLSDRRKLVREIMEQEPSRLSGAKELPVRLVEGEIGWAKARLVAPADFESTAKAAGRRVRGSAIADLYERYEIVRARRGVLDLDDLLLHCADTLERDDSFARAVRWRFRHVFVDEMQDVNPAQFRLLRLLCSEESDLFTVGDPDQAVYGWNGADPSLLEDLPTLMPGTRVLRLDDNHRSSPQIVRTAAAALARGGASARSLRPDSGVPQIRVHDDPVAEADWVAQQVWLSRRPGARWEHMAVLARTNAQLPVIAAAFERLRIPWRNAGQDRGPASDVDPDMESAHSFQEFRGWVPSHDGTVDAVVLSTFHRAKGLQWPVVFVIGLNDAYVPLPTARSTSAKAEERRLLYVALSRAEDELWCSWARQAGTDRPVEAEASPWLVGIEEAIGQLQREALPTDPESVPGRVAQLRALVASDDEPPTPIRRHR